MPPGGLGELGLSEVAAAQRGVVTRAQLVELGFSPKAIEHRVATAALLYAGDNAVLSHESAAAVSGGR